MKTQVRLLHDLCSHCLPVNNVSKYIPQAALENDIFRYNFAFLTVLREGVPITSISFHKKNLVYTKYSEQEQVMHVLNGGNVHVGLWQTDRQADRYIF